MTPTQPKSVGIISLGCPRTLVDSELHLGRLKKAGFEIRNDIYGADVAVINTCSFIQDAIKESIDTILQALELKKQGKVKVVVVAGCLVQRFKDELIKELPEVDGFVGVDGFGTIDEVVRAALAGKRQERVRRRPVVPHRGDVVDRVGLTPSHYAYLKISEGCLKGCSFCIIPRIKGPLSSRKMESVIAETRSLVEERGVRELIVVGQDTSDYGVDLYGTPRIAELMEKLSRINGLRWIRLLYCHPYGLSEKLMQVIRDCPAVCKYLDMAVEHADSGVLARMNRLLNQEQLRERIARLRAVVPGVTLRSSIIVGFPGETEKEFETLLRFLKEIRFERLGAFTYSAEKDSAAIRMDDQVPESVKQKRLARLMELQQEIATSINAQCLGRTTEVVIDEVDEHSPGQFIGRTSADCPDVDGVVYVKSDAALKPGDFVPVKITDTMEYDLVGTHVPQAG